MILLSCVAHYCAGTMVTLRRDSVVYVFGNKISVGRHLVHECFCYEACGYVLPSAGAWKPQVYELQDTVWSIDGQAFIARQASLSFPYFYVVFLGKLPSGYSSSSVNLLHRAFSSFTKRDDHQSRYKPL